MTKTATPPHPDHDKSPTTSTQFKEYEGIEEDPNYENWEKLEEELKKGEYDLSGMLIH